MEWKQLLFKIVTITLDLLTILVSIYLTSSRRIEKKPFDSDTFDYDQHDYILSSDCSPDYGGFCLNEGVCFFPADTNGVVRICPYSCEGRTKV